MRKFGKRTEVGQNGCKWQTKNRKKKEQKPFKDKPEAGKLTQEITFIKRELINRRTSK